MRRLVIVGALVLLSGCMVNHHIELNAVLVPLAGQSIEQKQIDMSDCTQRGAEYASRVVDAAAGRAVTNALVGAMAGAATGAATGAAFGNGLAGFGAKVGTASWGTQAAMAGALTQPDWYAVAYDATGACLIQRGYAIQSLTRVL